MWYFVAGFFSAVLLFIAVCQVFGWVVGREDPRNDTFGNKKWDKDNYD